MLLAVYHHRSSFIFNLPTAAHPIGGALPVLCRCSSNYSKNDPITPLSLSSSQNPEDGTQNPQTSSASNASHHPSSQLLRRHNSKSASLLIQHLKGDEEAEEDQRRLHNHWPLKPAALTAKERAELLQMALVRKRPPQFPGSIYARKAHKSHLSLPPLSTLLNNGDGYEEDNGELMRVIEIRRKETFEIVVDEVRRKGKFGITYATNLASQLSDFIDLLMVEAAELKKEPEFSESSFNHRARTVIAESNLLPLVRWLKHNALSYNQIGRLVCMSRGNLDSIRTLAEWLKSIHVKGRFIGVVLTRVGKTILWRSTEELDENVRYLESCGIRMDWMGYVVCRCPELLAFTIEELKTRVEFYTNMGMNEHDFGTMIYDCPKVLGFFTLEEMKFKVCYLKEFGFNDEEVGKLLAFKPQLMVCSIEEKWKPLIKYFYYLGIDRNGLKRILVIKPMVFCVDLEQTIVPKVRFLQDIGIRNDAIGNMIVKFPPLLTYSLYKKIRPVVIFLLTKAGVKPKDIAKVIALAPELLGCSIAHKLDGHVKYFLSLGITLQRLGEMIADFPMLLRYNIELLRPKYRYLRRTMVRPLKDLIEFPRFFSYSLEERIIPRHRIMVENRVNFKLRYMLAGTDEDFNQRVKAAVERRQRYESGIVSSLEDEEEIDDRQPVHTATTAVSNDVSSNSETLGRSSIDNDLTFHGSYVDEAISYAEKYYHVHI